ncbi:hypothetical protein BH11BAC4_BH11BAC4_19770 [soil metagenome]
MKKLLLGMILGAAITSGIFYYINKQNENEARENLTALLVSAKESKTTQQKLTEALNDPKAELIIPNALTVIGSARDQLFYYKGNDCSKLLQTDFINIKEILNQEKKQVPANELMIIIKMMPGASFRNSIDILDAITTAGIPAGHFAEVNPTEKEKDCLQNYKHQ